jgi:hypothetical protein
MTDYLAALPIDLTLYLLDFLDSGALLALSSANRAYLGLIWSRWNYQEKIFGQFDSKMAIYTVRPIYRLIHREIDEDVALFELLKQVNCIDKFKISITAMEDAYTQHLDDFIEFELFGIIKYCYIIDIFRAIRAGPSLLEGPTGRHLADVITKCGDRGIINGFNKIGKN